MNITEAVKAVDAHIERLIKIDGIDDETIRALDIVLKAASEMQQFCDETRGLA